MEKTFIMKVNKRVCLAALESLILLISILSCSLKYDEVVNAEDSNPEFVFTHATMLRYEKGEETAKIQADSIDNIVNTPVTFIKMDVEGSEAKAIAGAFMPKTRLNRIRGSP